MLGLQQKRKLFQFSLFLIGFLYYPGLVCAQNQMINAGKTLATILPSPALNFTVPETIYPGPAWALSAAINAKQVEKTAILSQFDPLWQEKLASGTFEQIQSVIIPGGIIDVANDLIYMENGTNDIVVLDIQNGKVLRHIKNICCPLALVDNCLLALARSKKENNKLINYDLLMLNGKIARYKWKELLLPGWLNLPVDGDGQKFIFNVHCYDNIFSVSWQASHKQVFPNPLSLLIPSMAQPQALQGSFTCNLTDGNMISQTMEEGAADFLGYLTANENLPAQIALDTDTVAIRKYNYYLFLLVRSYPPENNIAGAGVLAKRELRVKDMRNGKILWTHILPATFMPLAF